MGKFTEHDVLLQMAKQTAFGALAGSPNGRVVPIARGSQGFDHTRNKIENDARYADGYKRAFALGNNISNGELPLVANIDYAGFPLFGLCGAESNMNLIAEITVTNGGANYDPGTTVTITPANGATATATIVAGVITKITVTSKGTSNFASAPAIGFGSVGSGTGAAATATLGTMSTMKPGKVVIPYTGEEAIGANYYQYFDQVYKEMKVEYDNEGMFKPSFTTQGTGKFLLATSSMDSSPTEVAGAPAEMLNWGILDNGVDKGEIQKCSLTVTREIVESRPSGKSGIADELLVGQITVAISLSALFQDDTRWANARNGVYAVLESTITRGWREHYWKTPELKFVPKSPKKPTGQPVVLELEGEAIFESDSASPITFKHFSAITDHNT